MTDSFIDPEDTFAKLEELFATIKDGKAFAFEVDGERIEIPAHADIVIEYDRDEEEHELEIQLYWDVAEDDGDDAEEDDDSSEDEGEEA